MTPRLVLRMEMPRPSSTGFRSRCAAVQPAARLADAFEVADDALAFGAVLQVDAQHLLRVGVHRRRVKLRPAAFRGDHGADLVVEDEALVLEHLGDVLLQVRGRHIHRRRLDAVALRMRVSMSAIGSVIMACGSSLTSVPPAGRDLQSVPPGRRDLLRYQLAFFTPGISPLLAMSRKQMRQMPNLR